MFSGVFDKNCYYSTASAGPWSIDFQHEAEHVLQFRYGFATYQKFCMEYDLFQYQNLRSDRLKHAFPGALWACASIVRYVVKAIFIGIPKLISSQTDGLKIYGFYIVRDCQEILGHMISIVSDKYGAYLTEESQLQKKCYDYYFAKHFSKK